MDHLADQGTDNYDQVVIATHADEALALLSDRDPLEQGLLSSWHYTKNRAVLHSDDGEQFACIVDHLVQFSLAEFNRTAKRNGRITGSDGRKSQAMTVSSMSAARQASYAAVESLDGALSMRGQSMSEAGSCIGAQQRERLQKPRRRQRVAANVAPAVTAAEPLVISS